MPCMLDVFSVYPLSVADATVVAIVGLEVRILPVPARVGVPPSA